MKTFAEAEATLTHVRTGAPLQTRKVANNTYVHRIDADTIGVRLHSTDVVKYHRDGTVTLDSGGWQTVTTKERLNAFTTFSIGATSGTWYVTKRNPEYLRTGSGAWSAWTVPYWDGMTLDPSADVAPEVPETEELKSAADKETLRAISAYLRGLTRDVWADVVARAEAEGTSGDCLICQMGGAVAASDPSHLFEHLKERYYMATLARNALLETGYQVPYVIGHVDIVKRSLRRYLRAHCLIGNASGKRPSAVIGAHW